MSAQTTGGRHPLKYPSKDDCPDFAQHTPTPSGYFEWFAWAETMGKTHKQVLCPTCGYYAIWKRKAA